MVEEEDSDASFAYFRNVARELWLEDESGGFCGRVVLGSSSSGVESSGVGRVVCHLRLQLL